ncbi:DUF1501 domain-containing protein [Nocardioides sp. SYSU D00038]|uniref:DUF1501 domain-containing protein n=1 Tax=Nocardioides sp. SYSU D00038 TaxID=2812554 RepID=UPI0019670BC3|nr:DUF1501 domain-containing protein [Nocardioides sp. SYSU D00038]
MTRTSPRPAASPCCDEFARVSRRGLFGAAAVAGLSTTIGSAVLTAGPASAAPADSVLVVLSMRGAADGLSLVVPYTDPVYYQARPGIAVPKNALLATNGTFGLHPRMEPLLPFWNSGRIAAVHAAGLPVANRSHFSAMEALEDADPGSTTRVGWLNRLLGGIPGSSPLQGFNIGGGVVPTAMFGPQPVMASGDVSRVLVAGDDEYDVAAGRRRSLDTLWGDVATSYGRGMRTAFSAVDTFGPVRGAADTTAAYPDTDLGKALAQAARVIRGNVGVQVLTVDQGDWDMHTDVGTLEWGAMIDNVDELARSLAAFLNDLGDQTSKVTLVALSEFGRRVTENSSWGLDHGYGNVMFVMGAGVRGGYYADGFPALSNTLDADLPVTTDYRNVLADVVTRRFDVSSASVFPGLSRKSLGFML